MPPGPPPSYPPARPADRAAAPPSPPSPPSPLSRSSSSRGCRSGRPVQPQRPHTGVPGRVDRPHREDLASRDLRPEALRGGRRDTARQGPRRGRPARLRPGPHQARGAGGRQRPFRRVSGPCRRGRADAAAQWRRLLRHHASQVRGIRRRAAHDGLLQLDAGGRYQEFRERGVKDGPGADRRFRPQLGLVVGVRPRSGSRGRSARRGWPRRATRRPAQAGRLRRRQVSALRLLAAGRRRGPARGRDRASETDGRRPHLQLLRPARGRRPDRGQGGRRRRASSGTLRRRAVRPAMLALSNAGVGLR